MSHAPRNLHAFHNILSIDMCAQSLYKRVTEYLELEQRVTVLNNRFEVLTELLNIVREHENNLHIARLEWIVIWLIVVEARNSLCVLWCMCVGLLCVWLARFG